MQPALLWPVSPLNSGPWCPWVLLPWAEQALPSHGAPPAPAPGLCFAS